MRYFLLALLLASPLRSACTLTVTAPTAAQAVTTYTFNLTSSNSGCTTPIASAEYFVDGVSVGVVTTVSASFTLNWPVAKFWNGPRKVFAVGYDLAWTTLATSATVSFSTAIILVGTGWGTAPSLTCTFTPADGATWSGTVSASCTLSNKPEGNNPEFQIYVDSVQLTDTTQSGLTLSSSIDTTKFPDANQHLVVVTARGSTSANFYGQWQGAETFSNGTTHMEIHADAKELFLANGATHQLVLAGVNTDGSAYTPGSPTYALQSSPYNGYTIGNACSVNSSGLITAGTWTAGQDNNCVVKSTSSGLTTSTFVFIRNTNVIGNLGTDGQTHQSYVSGKSIYLHDGFFGGEAMTDVSNNQTPTTWATGYTAAGYNAVDAETIAVSQPWSTTQSTFQSQLNAFLTTYQSWCTAYPGLYVHGTSDNSIGQDSYVYAATRGAPSAFSPSAIQYMVQQFANMSPTCLIGVTRDDEDPWGSCPLCSATLGGSPGGPSSIACVGGTCTVTQSPTININASDHFIIHGATTNSSLNNAAGTTWTASSVGNTTMTFAGPAGTFTATSSTDPGLVLEPYGTAWFSSNTDYIHSNAFSVYRGWETAVAGHYAGTESVKGSGVSQASAQALYNLEGDPNFSDYADVYTLGFAAANSCCGAPAYTASKIPPNAYPVLMGAAFRRMEAVVPDGTPLLMQANGIAANYGIEGTSISITSASNGALTLSANHNIGTVYPNSTRGIVSGSSTGAYNGRVWIYAIPASNQVNLYLDTPNFTGTGTGTGIQLHFSGGTTLSCSPGGGLTIHVNDGSGTTVDTGGGCLTYNQVAPLMGHTYTVSGSSNSTINSTTFIFPGGNKLSNIGSPGGSAFSVPLAVVPSGVSCSSSCGTIEIIANNYYNPGANFLPLGQYPLDSSQFFLDEWYAALLGAGGVRTYTVADDLEAYDSVNGYSNNASNANGLFHTGNNNDVQAGIGPGFENGIGAQEGFAAKGNAALLVNRLTAFLFQPHLASPDYGPRFEATARGGSLGNFLSIQAMEDTCETVTASLSPYLVSGQQVLKYYANQWRIVPSTIASGTASDTQALCAGETVAYLFPNSYGTYAPSLPTVATGIAGVAGATSTYIQWAHQPAILTLGNAKWASVSCGGNASCQIPGDTHVGPIAYQVVATDASGNILNTGSVQSVSAGSNPAPAAGVGLFARLGIAINPPLP